MTFIQETDGIDTDCRLQQLRLVAMFGWSVLAVQALKRYSTNNIA